MASPGAFVCPPWPACSPLRSPGRSRSPKRPFGAVVTEAAATSPSALQLLVEALQEATAAARLGTVQQLRSQWALFCRANVTLDGATHLLALLLQFLTPRGSSQDEEALAATAFALLHQLLGSPAQPHFAVFLEAMQAILEELGLTDRLFYRRPPPPLEETVPEAFNRWEIHEEKSRQLILSEEDSARGGLWTWSQGGGVDACSSEVGTTSFSIPPFGQHEALFEELLGVVQAAGVEQEVPYSWPPDTAVAVGAALLTPSSLQLDRFLHRDEFRARAVALLQTLDRAGVNPRFLLKDDVAHLFLPHRLSGRAKVFRDFVQCSPTPRCSGPLGAGRFVHVKTNIAAKSDIMYRFLVEGYNYGNNAIIHCDVVGYTHNRWDTLGRSELYGWPAGWDKDSILHYAPGVDLSQYYSTDGFVTLRLHAPSLFCVGFTISAWLVCHTYGADFSVWASVHHQDEDL